MKIEEDSRPSEVSFPLELNENTEALLEKSTMSTINKKVIHKV